MHIEFTVVNPKVIVPVTTQLRFPVRQSYVCTVTVRKYYRSRVCVSFCNLAESPMSLVFYVKYNWDARLSAKHAEGPLKFRHFSKRVPSFAAD